MIDQHDDTNDVQPSGTIFEETHEEGSLQDTVRQTREDSEIVLNDWSSVFINHALVQKFKQSSKTVTQTREVFRNEPHKESDPTIEISQLPNHVIYDVMNSLPDESMDATDPKVREWLTNLENASFQQSADEQYLKSLAREGSKWQQHLANGDQKLGLSRVRIRDSRNDDRAALRVMSALSVGGAYSVPLWHSGFWVTIRKPSNSALMDLEQSLLMEKIRFFKTTYGRSLSHMTAFTSSIMLDFIIDHIHATNLENRESIKELILAPDVPFLAWELAALVWSKGWNYTRSIIGDPNDPNLVISQRVEVGSMGWVDNSRFDDYQLAHMSRRAETVTIKEVEEYQSRFKYAKGRVVQLTDNDESEEQVFVRLKTPSASQAVTMGMRWINDIVHTYDAVAGVSHSARDRNEYVDKHAKATSLRMYDHYVEEIIVKSADGEEEPITSDTVRQTVLDHLSADEEKRDKFMEAVRDFIDDSVVAVVAVPVYDEKELKQVPQLPRFPYLIPVDPINLFFTLLVRSLNRVRSQ